MRLPGEIAQGILARAALTLLRVYLGVVFLVAGASKLRQGYTPHLISFLEQVGLEQGHRFYQDFIRSVVIPNASLVAGLMTWGEIVVGLLLVLGLLTRLAAVAAFLLVVNYMLAKGAWFWTPSSADGARSLIAIALLIGAAGRTLGLDAFLARRWPRSPLW